MAGFLLLATGLIYSLRYPTVQTYFAKQAAAYLSDELHTTVSLQGIYFKPFSSLVLRGLYIEDLEGDTLLYSRQLSANLNLRELANAAVAIRRIRLSDSQFSLKRDSGGTNLSFILNYFQGGESGGQPAGRKITWNINDLELDNVSLRYHYTGVPPKAGTVNFRDIELTRISGNVSAIDFSEHLLKAEIHELQLQEKSGFKIRKLNTLAVVDSNRLELHALDLETNRSHIRDYLLLEYADFGAFDDFVRQVDITLDLKRSRINSKDIAFFAPNVNVTNFNILLSGNFSGRIPKLSARNMVLQTGQHTRLAGDATVEGLPDINRALFDLRLDELQTNSWEIESLVPQLGNTPLLDLPEIFDRMGDIRYQGSLTGHYLDFVAYGMLETDLGTINTDIHLDIADQQRYSGKLSADTFDVGTLLNYEKMGRGSFDMMVDGQGFAAHDVNSEISGHVGYLEFSGYQYRDIDIQGRFDNLLFAGALTVADPNLQLTFDGEANFNPRQPAYHFYASVAHADLSRLRLYDKKPVVLHGGTITSNFTGNTLNNIQGSIAANDIQFQVDTGSYTIDSVALLAKGDEEHRVLWLTSDVMEATLSGETDLPTLSAYFQSVAMRYAPAMGLALKPSGKQDFHVDLTLKDFTPIAPFVEPALAIGKGASLTGYFSSAAGAANFNLLVPTLHYGNLRIEQLIADETTNNEALRLLVTADRVSLTDSLYIDNVNMTNTLTNDSLYFNLKLAHTTASNRIDLNGLMHFREEQPAELRFLPSAVILNQEPWQLGNQALIHLDRDRLRISDMELTNGNQTVRLDGVISPQTGDEAVLTFSQFDLSTFNAAMRPSGIRLDGIVNGQMNISSLLKQPYFIADIEASGIHYNDTEVGDLLLQADFDQHTKLVNVNMEVVNHGIRTILATGTYNAAAVNKLDMRVALNKSELIIFQPLLKNLVSNITGTVSADLRITGTALNPQVDGRFSLHDAGFTVNYLKTPYRIDDEVYLSNSTLLLTNLTVTDPMGNQALANGKVDLSNIRVPDIDLTIDATNFLVLHTTLRDNPLYYGTAYGTGRFAFHGPTNAINITVKARTNENTRLAIPLNAVGTVSDNDFIRFVSQDTVNTRTSTSQLLKGLSLNMDFQVTPDAEISLYTDLGELSGRGTGALSLRISSLGDFEMFGDYAINSGKFTLTAQDFINKIFDINQGGTIRWTGQPTEATIALTAVYEQRTSLSPLYNAAGRETNEQRALAQAQMNLSGNLMRPDITFGLNFPNDPYVKDELQGYLSDANNVNQQTLSLIVRRSFTPGSATDFSRELNNTLLSAGTELAFNQLNNIIAQSLNLNFVDLNIRSLNDASASVHLFNDRLILTGGVTDRRNVTDLNVFSDRVATDAEVQYLIRKDGRLVLRASNRLNSRNFLLNLNDNNYVSAVGLVYRQEFYTFGEFLRRLLTLRSREEEENEEVF